MKNKKENSVIVIDVINRLKEYYPYDEDSRTFTIPFYFEKVEEIIDKKHHTTKKVSIKKEFLQELEDALYSIPDGYYANIEVNINDYQEYNQEIIMQSINDLASDQQFRGFERYRKDCIKAGIITILGAFWIILSFAGEFFGWWGDINSTTNNVITGFFSIFAVVFIWEAVSMVVIHIDPFIVEFGHLLSKMKYFILKNNEGVELKEQLSDISFSFKYYRLRAASDYIFLFSSFSFFGLDILRAMRYFGAYLLSHYEIGTYEIVTTSILFTMMTVLGVFGILIYRGYIKFIIPSFAINALTLFVAIANLIFTINQNEPKENVVSAIFIIAISVIVFVGLFIKHFLCYKRKQTCLK